MHVLWHVLMVCVVSWAMERIRGLRLGCCSRHSPSKTDLKDKPFTFHSLCFRYTRFLATMLASSSSATRAKVGQGTRAMFEHIKKLI